MTSMRRELYYTSESRKGHIWKDVLQVIGALKEVATQHIGISRNIFLMDPTRYRRNSPIYFLVSFFTILLRIIRSVERKV